MELPRRHVDAAGFLEVFLGLFKALFIDALQTHQAGQSRGVPAFQTQGGIGRIVPAVFLWIVVIIALQFKAAKDALHPKLHPSFVMPSGPGLVGGVDLIGATLQKVLDQNVGRLENGQPQEHFQLLHIPSHRGQEMGD